MTEVWQEIDGKPVKVGTTSLSIPRRLPIPRFIHFRPLRARNQPYWSFPIDIVPTEPDPGAGLAVVVFVGEAAWSKARLVFRVYPDDDPGNLPDWRPV